MNTAEISTSMDELFDTWRYQAMTDSERERWTHYLQRVERSDFAVALDRATSEGAKRRPALGEFAEYVRVAASGRRRREDTRTPEPWPEPDPTVRDRYLAECREALRQAGARAAGGTRRQPAERMQDAQQVR